MFVTLEEAQKALKSEEVVAIPTETVYGLAGSLYSQKAIEKIFSVKQRPFFDPLIVHVSNVKEAQDLASEWSPLAQALAQKYWPGPLTIVAPKAHAVSDMVTSGLQSVGLRWPRHDLTQKLLEVTGPLAAPSANLFGRTSPSTAAHVESEFAGSVKVLDGGACDIGIESTVVKIDGDRINFLRKGIITKNEIIDYLKSEKISFQIDEEIAKKFSPGEMNHHYMPNKPLIYVGAQQRLNWKAELKLQIEKGISIDPEFKMKVDLKAFSSDKFQQLQLPVQAAIAARALYSTLRALGESADCDVIFFIETKEQKESFDWEAILDRLFKASVVRIV
jgi:L-threonylcarbamoyladenylate synthase